MKKLLPLSLSLLLCLQAKPGAAQAPDTADHPYFQAMMLEPGANYYRARSAFDKYWAGRPDKKGNGYKQFKRWELRVKEHLLQDGTVQWNPAQLDDFLAVNGMRSGNNFSGSLSGGGGNTPASPCPGLGRWQPVGPVKHPYNQSGQPTGIGRIGNIAFHPTDSNTIFACAPQGGVWKSTDNGVTWSLLWGTNSIVNSIGASSLVLSYNNPDTMYLGTGDIDAGDAPGYGVLWSLNGGSTWASRNSGMGNLAVGRIIIHPTNSAILLASTNGGIFRSTNKGSSWTRTSVAAGFTDVVFSPMNPNMVYAAGNGGRFYRSTDNGVTWTNVTSGLPTSAISRGQVAVSLSDRAYVYFLIANSSSGYYGTYRSTDSGANFSTMSTTPNILGYSNTGSGGGGQGWYDLDLAADPFNRDIIYACGINIWKSTNGGTSWVIVAHWVGSSAEDVHADAHILEFSRTGRKLYNGNDGGIYYTANAGSRWTNISTGIQNSQIYRIAQAKSNEWVNNTGYQDNGSAVSERDAFYTYYGGDGTDCQVDPGDASYIYGAYIQGRIYRALDKTNTRDIAANGLNGVNETGPWVTSFILQEGNPSRMWAAYNNIWRSDDVKTTGTITFTRISLSLAGTNSSMRYIENPISQPKMLYALRFDNKLFRTSDATVATPSWTDLSAGVPGSPRWIEAHSKDSNIIYMAAGTSVYRSNNRGVSWGTSLSIGINVNCLVFDSSAGSEIVYAGTEKGVVRVNFTGTPGYVDFQTGFPLWADVTDIDIYYNSNKQKSHIIASTYGRGVWKSNLHEDGTLSPKAGFYAFDTVATVNGTLKFFEKCENTVTSFNWKIKPYGKYSYVNGTDSTSKNPEVKFTASDLFTIKLLATNCQGTDSMSKANWVRVFPAPVAANCKNTTNYGTNNYSIGTYRIMLSDNVNETGAYFDDGEYVDFSGNKVFRLKPSTSYTITLKSGLFNAQYERAFIDYDNNGKFENFKSEVLSSSVSNIGTKTITFTTPGSLKLNQGMRMRILNDFYTLDTNACQNLDYGTGEDYSIVYDKPDPLFKASLLSVCIGGSSTFTDTSKGLIYSWDWDFGSGASPRFVSGKGPHAVTYTTSGTKSVRLRVNGLDSNRKTTYITVSTIGSSATASVKSGSNPLCPGQSVTLVARTVGTGLTFQWYKNNVLLAGKTDSLLVLSAVLITDSGSYKCVIQGGACGVTTNNLALVVNPKPTPAFSISADMCLKGNSYSFTNSSSISPGSISGYQWKFGDNTTSTTSSPVKKYNSAGAFSPKLIATSAAGCIDSLSKILNVFPQSLVKYSVNDTDQCKTGNSFVFTNNSTVASGSFTSAWTFGDGGTSGTASPTYSYSAAFGIFNTRLITTTNNGCKDTATKPVRIYAMPAPGYSLNYSAACVRGNRFVTANTSTISEGSYTNFWRYGNGGTSSATSPVITYGVYGTYSLMLINTSNFGCKDSLSQTLTVHPNANAKYSVNDSDQCKSGHSFVFSNLTSIPGGSISGYDWDFGDATSSTLTNPTKSYSTAFGIFAVRLISTSSNSCKDTVSKPVRVYAQPLTGFNINAANQCKKGNNFVFSNTSSIGQGSNSYLWNYGNGQTATSTNGSISYLLVNSYSVKLVSTSDFGCKDSLSKSVTVYPQTRADFSVNDSDQCFSGNNFGFTNTSGVSSGTFNNAWSFGDGGTSTLQSPSRSYAAAGNYSVRLVTTTNNACKDTAVKTVIVYSTPAVAFTLNNYAQCLSGNIFSALNSSNSPDPLSYNWNFGNGQTSLGMAPTFSYSVYGNYKVKLIVTSNKGCRDSAESLLTVHPQIKTGFSVNDTTQCLNGNSYVFINQSVIPKGSFSNVWSFGDLSSGTVLSPTKTYNAFGIFGVKLTTTSDKGCRDSFSKPLRVYDSPKSDFTVDKLNACYKGNVFNATNTGTLQEGNYTVLWKNGDASQGAGLSNKHSYASHGIYELRQVLTSNFGCKDSVLKTITVYASPVAGFTLATEQCENKPVDAINTSTLAAGAMIQDWDNGDGDKFSSTHMSTLYPDFGFYDVKLILTSDNNCKDTAGKTIHVASIPDGKFKIEPPIGCANQTIFKFVNMTTDKENKPLKFKWEFGDSTTDTLSLFVNHIYKYPRIINFISLFIESPQANCPVMVIDTLRVLPRVSSDFVWKDINKESKRFIALDTQIAGYSYTWRFSDGETGAGRVDPHKFPNNDSFSALLVVQNPEGCMDSSVKRFQILSPNYKKQDNELNFYAYPNPTVQKTTYKFELSERRPVKVMLHDAAGQLVYSKDWGEMDAGVYYEDIDFQKLGLSNGTYPLMLRSGKIKETVKVVFRQH